MEYDPLLDICLSRPVPFLFGQTSISLFLWEYNLPFLLSLFVGIKKSILNGYH